MTLTLLLALTGAVYAAVGSHRFVYEDAAWQTVIRPDWTPRLNLALWSFNVQTWLGASAGALHLGNLAIHLINGVLVYALALAVCRDATTAALTAFIFLLHPIQREAVNYISGRPDLLSTTGVLGALLATLAALRRHPAWALLAVLCLALAITTKPSAVAGLGLVLATIGVLEAREREAKAIGWALVMIGTFAAAAWVPIAYTEFLQPSLLELVTFAGRQGVTVLHLLTLIVWPVGFSIDHNYAGVTVGAGLIALAALGLGARALGSVRHQRPVLAWAGLWLLIALLPRLVTLGGYRGGDDAGLTEHHFYLSMPGVAMTIALGLKGLCV